MQMEIERKLKYTNVSTGIQLMGNMKCFVIPVIIGVAGIVIKGPKISGNNIGKRSIVSTNNGCTRDIAHSKESATV
jgi:hypothetical protein